MSFKAHPSERIRSPVQLSSHHRQNLGDLDASDELSRSKRVFGLFNLLDGPAKWIIVPFFAPDLIRIPRAKSAVCWRSTAIGIRGQITYCSKEKRTTQESTPSTLLEPRSAQPESSHSLNSHKGAKIAK